MESHLTHHQLKEQLASFCVCLETALAQLPLTILLLGYRSWMALVCGGGGGGSVCETMGQHTT